MADKNGEFSGVEKAAILMLSLGEGEAAEVLKHMTAKEVQKVGQAMAAVGGVSREQIEKVMGDFAIALDKQTSVGIGADDYVRKVLVQALGEDKAGSVIDRILLGRNSSGMEMLKWMDPRAIADLIRNEHPQIMAIVLSHLEPDQAADTLRNFPERVRADVLLRVATLDNVPPVALNELNEVMEKQFAGAQGSKATTIGGVKVAANILNFVDSGQDQVILGAIGKIDQAL
ncbi:MAG: flagellar motor switch protein FliG, partial [Lysobacteraceae bacterium]